MFDSTVGEDGALVLENILPKKVHIETAGVSIEVDPESAQIVKRQKIDGREYLMIPIETGTEVSGVSVARRSIFRSYYRRKKKSERRYYEV